MRNWSVRVHVFVRIVYLGCSYGWGLWSAAAISVTVMCVYQYSVVVSAHPNDGTISFWGVVDCDGVCVELGYPRIARVLCTKEP